MMEDSTIRFSTENKISRVVDSMKINVIFPMAGDGTRFGGTQFKPFIDGTEKLFIELAKEPFDIYKERYQMEFFFIYRKDQEDSFQVSKRLSSLFPKDTLHMCILSDKTSGPAETLAAAVSMYNLSGSAFICDCDHAINIQPMIQYLESNNTPDIIIPLLSIQESEQEKFGKVKLDKQGKPLAFCEKELIPFSNEYDVKGLVGCYFFKEVKDILEYAKTANISDLLPVYIQKHTFQCIDILEAGLFGTPESLIQYRFQLARKKTFFVDIDGTLIYLPKHVSYDANDVKLLPGAIEKLTEWKQQGHAIVLTTGRETARREKLITMLHELKIPYDQLVTNLRPGPRILINDKKPYSEIHQMAKAVQIRRNEGIAHIDIEETPDIVKRLKGGSFANVYLISRDGTNVVRKYIEKTKTNTIHVDTLRRQYEDMKRLTYYSPSLMPKVLSMSENECEYYFDMEYLEHHTELIHFPSTIQQTIVSRVLDRLHTDIYCYAKGINGSQWMKEFLDEKIFAKYSYIESLGPQFARILHADTLLINGISCKGIRAFLEDGTSILASLCPNSVSPIHGDLTLENILYDKDTDTFFLIDPSGSRYVDCKEMDLAKILQSLLAKYETWDIRDDLLEFEGTTATLPNDVLVSSSDQFDFLFSKMNDTYAFSKAVFMLACYLIRMTPFLLKKSEKHAMFGLILATSYFSSATA